MSKSSETPQIGISFPETALDVVDKAATHLGKSRSAFIRNASVAAAAAVLGVEAPTVEMAPGRKSPLAAAAAAAGLDVKTYCRQCAEMANGIRAQGAFEVPAPKAEETPKAA